jgi:hypothetical protein
MTNTQKLEGLTLQRGSHVTAEAGMCLLEAVSYIAGEPFGDHPACVDSVLGAFGRAVNDFMSGDERQLLVPLIPKLLNTAGDHKLSLRRAMRICDGTVRQILPIAFDAILPEEAKKLRDLPAIDSGSAAESAASAAIAAWSAAESAASAAIAAASAARSAASAAESAAESAASAAASAAESAAESAAWSAARSAARSAAESAAWSAAYQEIRDAVLCDLRADDALTRGVPISEDTA